MARQYDEDIDVRETPGLPGTPEAFLWRGRLYLVRGVLGHWRERRAWWTGRAARVLHGQDTSSGPADLPGGGVRVALGEEDEMWRVAASPGRAAGHGIYDLCRSSASAESDPTSGGWRLLRVAD
jgi:hypothetical protein